MLFSLRRLLAALLFSLGLIACSDPPAPITPPVSTPTPEPAPEPTLVKPTPPAPFIAEVHYEATPTFHEPMFPWLHKEDNTSSVSVGTVTDGYLVNARHLPTPGDTYSVLRPTGERGLVHSSQDMIDLLLRVADKHFAATGRRLDIGNLGQRGGGDISHSVSHNSGRDADLAFCYQTRKGEAFSPKELIPLDKKGVSRWKGGHRFDAACTWSIVKALLQDDQVQLQHLFISDPLRKQLLTHARDTKEDQALQQRAAQMLTQPSQADQHSDHLHVRLYCNEMDVRRGCVNQGRELPWAKLYKEEKAQAIETLLANIVAAADQLSLDQLRDIKRLSLLRPSSDQLRPLLPLLTPKRGMISHDGTELVHLLITYGDPPLRRAVMDHVMANLTHGIHVHPFLETLVQHPMPGTGKLLARLIAEPAFNADEGRQIPIALRKVYTAPHKFPSGLPSHPKRKAMSPVEENAFSGEVHTGLDQSTWTLAKAAVEASAYCACKEPVPALIAALSSQDPLLRARAARALRRITNHSSRINFDKQEMPKGALRRGIAYWTSWHEKYGKKSREQWVTRGFKDKKYKVHKLSKRHIWELVRAISSSDHLSWNAQRALAKMTRHNPDSLHWSKPRATRYWTRWLDRHRKTLGLPRCPDPLPCVKKR